MSLVLFKLPIHPRLSLGTFVGNVKYTIDGYVATQQHFLNGLITAAEHETQATDTLRTMDVVWTAYRSAEEGRCLTV